MNDSGAKINNHILDNFSDSDVNLDCIPPAEGNHQMNLSESNSNMAQKQPLFVGPSTELNTPAFPQQSMCDQYMNNPTFAPSNPIYDMQNNYSSMGFNYVKQESPFMINSDNFKQENYNGINYTKEEGKNEKGPKVGRKRNKYKMLPPDLKKLSVSLAKKNDPKYSSNFYGVPLKSLKRWIKVGCERKEVAGRLKIL